MQLTQLKKTEVVAFLAFVTTNLISSLVSNVKDNEDVKRNIKSKFGILWNHSRQLMNEIDREEAKLNAEKKSKIGTQLRDGYDQATEDLTIFMELWVQAESSGKREEFMSNLQNL